MNDIDWLISLATNTMWKTVNPGPADEEWSHRTDWHNVAVFKKGYVVVVYKWLVGGGSSKVNAFLGRKIRILLYFWALTSYIACFYTLRFPITLKWPGKSTKSYAMLEFESKKIHMENIS